MWLFTTFINPEFVRAVCYSYRLPFQFIAHPNCIFKKIKAMLIFNLVCLLSLFLLAKNNNPPISGTIKMKVNPDYCATIEKYLLELEYIEKAVT